MAKQKKQPGIGYKITQIQTLKFSFKDLESTVLNNLFNATAALAINMNTSLNVDKEKSTVTIDINTQLLEKEKKEILVEHSGRTVYFVHGLDEIYNEKKNIYDIPDVLVIQFYSMAYSHSRALLATEISPTIYKDKYLLPVIDPTDFLKTSDIGNQEKVSGK